MDTIKILFPEFREAVQDREGIVLLGCGGDPSDWIDGVTRILSENDIIASEEPSDTFETAYHLTTSGGRTDLALVFKKEAEINIGQMAMWRLQFGDCSWISDYLTNYASQHAGGIPCYVIPHVFIDGICAHCGQPQKE